jgi:membrane-associated phospholipid phosphatase
MHDRRRAVLPVFLAVAGVLAWPAAASGAEQAQGAQRLAPQAATAPLPPARTSSLLDGRSADGRRTTGRFFQNLGRNAVGVFSTGNLRPLLIGATAAGAGSFFDEDAREFFADQDRFAALGRTGARIGEAGPVAVTALALFASGRASGSPRFRAMTYDVAQAFLVNGAYTHALKNLVGRRRPDGSNRHSFPSGHASNAFAWATVAGHHYGPKVGVPAFAVAALVGASRLERNVHHVSDVVAGAALGYIVGRTVVREDGQPLGRPRWSLVPALGPSGTGVGLGLSVSY